MYWLHSFRNDAGALPGMSIHDGSVHQIPSPVMTTIITIQTTNKVIKSSRLRWAGHVVRVDDNELPKKNIVDKPWRSTRMWPTEIKMD
jgi:hypothetical protein